MGDRFSDRRGSNDEVINNIRNENFADERIYPCNFCHKIFTCPQALGRHRNAHKDDHLPMIGPSNLFTTPPLLPHSDLLAHAPYYYQSPMTRTPNYSNPYDLLAQICRRHSIFAPTDHALPRYQPYAVPPNRFAGPRPNGTIQTRANQYVGFNGSVRPSVNPNPRLFGISLQEMPVNQSTNLQPAHYVPRGSSIERDEIFMKCQNDYNNSNEHGTSSSGQMQGTGGIRNDDEEEELDLTLHL